MSLWPIIWQLGLGGTLIAGALFLAFVTTFKKTALVAACAVAIWLLGMSYGDHNGAARVQTAWNKAEGNMQSVGSKARSDAELAIPPADPDLPPGAPAPKPCVVRDVYDRDCHGR